MNITNFVQDFFFTGQKKNEINSTLITKKSSPINISHYIPINLCKVIYNIMAKILVGRL